MSDINFYKKLNPIKLPLTQVFNPVHFIDVPESWHIVISDIKNSTDAVNAGNHNNVNLIAAGGLIAALNIAQKHNVEIPFFFGGDGGTMIVPEEISTDVINALKAHNTNSKNNFNLELHVGNMQVKQMITAGHSLKIAKVQFGKEFNKAIVIGDGLKYAEQIIKQNSITDKIDNDLSDLNLTGLECRWDRIKPPSEENEIVCYLIEAINPSEQISIYRDVLIKIDEIYGSIQKRNPLSPERLKLLLTFQKIKKETIAKYGRLKKNYFTKSFIETFLGKLYFNLNFKANNLRGKEYLNQLINNADTLTIDGRINTIITGKMNKRIELLNYLTAQQTAGRLIFGHHISKESVMTCYIENRNEKHIHFVDGADGGYTEAAKELKNKLQQLDLNQKN
jgi:hypothetical protein